MSVPTTTKSPQNYVDFDEYVDYQLRKTRAHIKATDILTALVGITTFILAYLLLFVVVDQWLIPGGFGRGWRITLLLIVVVASFGWITWQVGIPAIRRITALYAARTIEEAEPALKSSLLNLIDLRRADRTISPAVLASLEKHAAVSLSDMDVDQAVDRQPLMRMSYALLAIVALLCAYTVFSPKKISSSLKRALLPTADVDVATRTELVSVDPGDIEIFPRSQLEVTVTLRGQLPERVVLHFTTADRRYVNEPVEMRLAEPELRQYRGTLTGENGQGILQDLSYHVTAADASSEVYSVTVIQPPSATVTSIDYQAPEYMGFDDKSSLGGHIDGWEGTHVTFHAKANMPLKSAVIQFFDTENVQIKAEECRMTISEETRLTADWTLQFRPDGTYPHFYRIACRNERGDSDPDPTLYNITIHPDEAPDIQLIDPVTDIEKPANAIVPLLVDASDPDFLLRYVTLRMEKNGEELNSDAIIFEGRRKSFRGRYEFKLAPLNLEPGETLTYWIEARDNKQPISNRRNTPRLKIRVTPPVSPPQVQDDLNRDKQRQEMQSAEAEQSGQDESGDGDGSQDAGAEHSADSGDSSNNDSQDDADPSADQPADTDGQAKNDDAASNDNQAGSQSADGKNPSEAQDNGDKGRPEPMKKDGSDDGEVLEKLLARKNKRDSSSGTDKPSDSSERPSPSSDEKDQSGTQSSKQEASSPSETESGDHSTPDRSQGNAENTDGTGSSTQQDDSPGSDGNRDEQSSNDGQTDSGTMTPSDDSTSQPNRSTENAEGTGEQTEPSNNADGTKPQSADSNQSAQAAQEGTADDTQSKQRTPSDGTERGTATPDKNPATDPGRDSDDVHRKEGAEPNTQKHDSRSHSDSADSDKANSSQHEQPNNTTPEKSKSTGQPTKNDTAPSDAASHKQPPSNEASKPNSTDPDSPEPRNPDMTEDKGEQSPDDSKSPKSDSPSPDGSPSNSGESDTGSKPPESTRQPSQSNDANSDSQSTDGQPGGEPSGSQGSKPSSETGNASGKPTDKQASGQLGNSGSQTGKTPGNASGSSAKSGPPSGTPTGGNPGNGGTQSGPGGAAGGGATNDAPEEANLEYTKQAVDLVLKQLRDELKRGNVDKDLLDELGWTEADLQQFLERLQGEMSGADQATSPYAEARRRQFEEMLRSLNLDARAANRSGADSPTRPTRDIGPRRMPVPAEIRELYEAYTKSLSKQKANQSNGR